MIDALVLLIVIIPVLMLPNYESIARVSALGNSLILIVFVVIGVYGLQEYGTEGFNLTSKKDLWPESFSAFSSWFGVCACKFYKLILVTICLLNLFVICKWKLTGVKSAMELYLSLLIYRNQWQSQSN